MRYLLIGGTGSLGQKLIDRLLPQHVVAVYSRDEAKHWTIRNKLSSGPLAGRLEDFRSYVGDVRDPRRILEVLKQERPEIVILAAALKQVDTCERSPSESIKTNILGIEHVIAAAAETQTPTLLLVSSDKSCQPVNTYGMCKALAERLVTSRAERGEPTRFLAVRYGNVLESRGSIVPLFRYQAAHAEALTVTDPEMTRFVMTLDQSVDLIERALRDGQSGETWLPHLPALRVGDLADLFSQISGKPIRIIGARPGEKMHEDLIGESESVRVRREGPYYVMDPAYKPGGPTRFRYTSADTCLGPSQLEQLLKSLGILEIPMDKFVGLGIEEIRTGKEP